MLTTDFLGLLYRTRKKNTQLLDLPGTTVIDDHYEGRTLAFFADLKLDCVRLELE
jgi:hypothetical protein